MDSAVRKLALGGRVVIDPAEAMLEQVYEAAANVQLYRFLVEQLGHRVDPGTGAIEGELESKWGELPVPSIDDIDRSELGGAIAGRVDPQNWKAAPHVYVVMYDAERERLVRFAKACRDAGVEEHRVQLAERMAAQLLEVNTVVVDGLLAAIVRMVDQGSLTVAAVGELRTGLVPGLFRRAIEGRVLSERAS